MQIREVSGTKRTIDLAEGETVIGRGAYLGVADKRVSRNHGIIKPVEGGVELKSIHSNPCFYTRKAQPETWLKLDKNESAVLKNGDTFSLLPKQYIFEVVCAFEQSKSDEGTDGEEKVGDKGTYHSAASKLDGHQNPGVGLKSNEVIGCKVTPKTTGEMNVTPTKPVNPEVVTGGEEVIGREVTPEMPGEINVTPTKAVNPEVGTGGEELIGCGVTPETTRKIDFDPTKAVAGGKQVVNKVAKETPGKTDFAPTKAGESLDTEPPKQFKKEFPQKAKLNSNKPETSHKISSAEDAVKTPQATVRSLTGTPQTFTDEEGRETALPSGKKRTLPSWMTDRKKGGATPQKNGKQTPQKATKTPKNKPSTARRTPRSTAAKRKEVPKLTFDSDSEEMDIYSGEPSTKTAIEIKVAQPVEKKSRSQQGSRVTHPESQAEDTEKNVTQPTPTRRQSRRGGKNDIQPVEKERRGSESGNVVTHPESQEDREQNVAQPQNETTEVVEMVDRSVQQSRVEEDVEEEEANDETEDEKDVSNTSNVSHPTSDVTSQGSPDHNNVATACSPGASNQSAVFRPPCAYGSSCYRRNQLHKQEFSHPGDSDYLNPNIDETNRPDCPYGSSCYRKNPLHKKQYNHSKRVAPKRAAKIRAARRKDEESSEDDYDFDDSFLNDDSDDDVDAGASEDEDSDWQPSQGASQTPTTTGTSSRGRKRKAKSYAEPDSDATTDEDDVEELVSDAKKFSKNRKMWKK